MSVGEDLLGQLSRLDHDVRKADRELMELQGQLKHYQEREKELLATAGVTSLREIEDRLTDLKIAVQKDLDAWSVKAQKVSSAIQEVEGRVGVRSFSYGGR